MEVELAHCSPPQNIHNILPDCCKDMFRQGTIQEKYKCRHGKDMVVKRNNFLNRNTESAQ